MLSALSCFTLGGKGTPSTPERFRQGGWTGDAARKAHRDKKRRATVCPTFSRHPSLSVSHAPTPLPEPDQEHSQFETLRVPNHTTWRFAGKTRSSRLVWTGRRCAAASRPAFFNGKTLKRQGHPSYRREDGLPRGGRYPPRPSTRAHQARFAQTLRGCRYLHRKADSLLRPLSSP